MYLDAVDIMILDVLFGIAIVNIGIFYQCEFVPVDQIILSDLVPLFQTVTVASEEDAVARGGQVCPPKPPPR